MHLRMEKKKKAICKESNKFAIQLYLNSKEKYKAIVAAKRI